ncbi:MAG TPA: hypothetical protein PKA64_26370, partial [Myxococcota bacterium]|nr:hypothetical protein [Myxococcota bacterium]
ALPALTELTRLDLRDNAALSTVELPSLGDSDWVVTADDNPALCVTAEPALAAPPPGCSVTASGNACDP